MREEFTDLRLVAGWKKCIVIVLATAWVFNRSGQERISRARPCVSRVGPIPLWLRRLSTRVLVTADHETGGMYSVIDNGQGVDPAVSWTSTSHSSSNVGVWAIGPKADLVSGEMDNNKVFHIMRNSYLFESRADTPQKTDGTVAIDWSVRPGDVYRLESADTPGAVSWNEVGVVTAAQDTISVTDTNAGSATRRFYRLQAID